MISRKPSFLIAAAVCSKDAQTALNQPVNAAAVFPPLGTAAEVNRNIAAIQTKPAGSAATGQVSFTVSQ